MSPSKRKRIGLIIPSSNTTLEVDFYRSFGAETTVHTARMYMEVVTRKNEKKMISEGLPQAIKMLKSLDPEVIVFGCTSGGALGGLEHDQEIGSKIEKKAKVKCVTVLSSVIDELRRMGAKKIGVFTPYINEVSKDIRMSLEEANFKVPFVRGMGLIHNLDVGKVTPDEICHFVHQKRDPSTLVDAYFLSCTNWRAYESLPVLKKKISIPMVTSSQAVIQSVKNCLEEMDSSLMQEGT
jgi:maleate isomerase